MLFVQDQGEEKGPYHKAQVKTMWDQGILTGNALYRGDSENVWKPVVCLFGETPGPIEGGKKGKPFWRRIEDLSSALWLKNQRVFAVILMLVGCLPGAAASASKDTPIWVMFLAVLWGGPLIYKAKRMWARGASTVEKADGVLSKSDEEPAPKEEAPAPKEEAPTPITAPVQTTNRVSESKIPACPPPKVVVVKKEKPSTPVTRLRKKPDKKPPRFVYWDSAGHSRGPVRIEHFQSLYDAGYINEKTLVREVTARKWRRAGEVSPESFKEKRKQSKGRLIPPPRVD